VRTTAYRQGISVVGRQVPGIADALHLRDVAIATTFWLSMGYNFGYMTASDMLFDSIGVGFRVKLSDEDIADFEVLRDVAIVTVFGFLYMGCIDTTWRIRLNRPCAAAMQPNVKLLRPLVSGLLDLNFFYDDIVHVLHNTKKRTYFV